MTDLAGLHPIAALQVALQRHCDGQLTLRQRARNLLFRLQCWYATAYWTLRVNGVLWWRAPWHSGHLYCETGSPHPNIQIGRCDCGHLSVSWVRGPIPAYVPAVGEIIPDGAEPAPAMYRDALPMTEPQICTLACEIINNLDALVQR